MSSSLSVALPVSTMMFNNPNGKRKLDAIIRNLTTQSEINAGTSTGELEDLVTKEPENNEQSEPEQVETANKRLKTEQTEEDMEENDTSTIESESEANSSAEQSFATNSVIESIRADFLEQQRREQSSALRDQLLEPPVFQMPPQQQQSPPQPHQLSTSSTSGENGNNQVKVTNVYRGLYPIKNVKEYFKKKTIDNQKLYICQWPGCTFQTWKYSQHISRHIYLKHIGIKELRCQVLSCEKVFKRPESLVQHVKNHICGFGIDPVRMKDPNNTCGVKNIKKHFNKIMDNDIQVFMCQFDLCKFVTNNSGSIRRHVHNQHICPHSSPAANGTGTHASARAGTPSRTLANEANFSLELSRPTASSPFLNHFASGSNSSNSNSNTPDEESSPAFDPLVVLTEYEGQTYDPVNRSINHETENGTDSDYNADSPMDLSGLSVRGITSSMPALNRIDADDDEDEEAEDEEMAIDEPKLNALPPNIPTGHYFGLPRNDAVSFAALSAIPSTSTAAPNLQNYLQQNLIAGPSEIESSPPLDAAAAAAAAAARRKNNGLYSLKNYKEHYYKIKTPESGVQFICKGCKFQAKSQITLIRHLWNELGYKEFHCEFEGCNRTFDNEFSRYKHRKFDHGQPTQAPGTGEGAVIQPALRPDAGLPLGNSMSDRYSPIPPLVPMPNQVQPVPPNSSYNSIASAFLNLNHQSIPTTSAISTNSFMHSYMNAPGIPFPTITTSTPLIVPPSTHHLSLPSHPFLPITATPSHSTSTITSAMFPIDRVASSFPSISPRRHSNGSLSDASTSSAAINSSLISILKAPSVAGSTSASNLPTQIPPFGHPPGPLDHIPQQQLIHPFGGQIHGPLDPALRPSFPSPVHSSPLQNGGPQASTADQRRHSTGIYSLKLYGDRFEKLYQPNGDVMYRCRLCETYKCRSQVSIVKHLRAHERGEILGINDRVPSPALANDVPRQRTASMFSLGAFSSGGEVDEDDEEDREISVEDDEVNVTGNESMFANAQEGDSLKATSSGAPGSIRKYNCRSKSGLYSLKKHEQDYIRSKGPDGYHYKCANCDEYTTKSQASMVRHIWTHKKQNFRCDCGESFENEFSLYKHKKTTHPELTSQHNRSSSKNANKERKEAQFNSAASTSTAPPPPFPSEFSHEPILSAEQFQQQQAFLSWLNSAQQFIALQQMQQHQQNLQESSAPSITAPMPEMFNLSAHNLAQVYQDMQNSDKKDEDEKTEPELSDREEEQPKEPEANQGMSRRALRFKSHQRKPVQIRQQEEEVKGDLKEEEEEDSENELEIDA